MFSAKLSIYFQLRLKLSVVLRTLTYVVSHRTTGPTCLTGRGQKGEPQPRIPGPWRTTHVKIEMVMGSSCFFFFFFFFSDGQTLPMNSHKHLFQSISNKHERLLKPFRVFHFIFLIVLVSNRIETKMASLRDLFNHVIMYIA